MYQKRHPELFADRPEFTVQNFSAASDLALLLRRAGDPVGVDSLIDAGLAWSRETQIPGLHGSQTRVADIELLALKGVKGAALDTLQDAADMGWGPVWQWDTSNENLSPIRHEPEFQAIIAQLKANMSTQLEAIRARPKMGEFDLRSAQCRPFWGYYRLHRIPDVMSGFIRSGK